MKKLKNSIEFVSDGTETFLKLLKIIDEAKTSIYISTFILGRDQVAEDIIKHLTEQLKKGIEVCFLIDGFGALFANKSSLDELRNQGGKVALFRPFFKIPTLGLSSNDRNHKKMVIVDGKKAMIGGMNLASEYMGPKNSQAMWSDIAFFLSGDLVTDLEAVFRLDWKFAKGKKISSKNVLKKFPSNKKSKTAEVISNSPYLKTSFFYDKMLAACLKAEKRIWIVTPYFIPDEVLTHALENASNRGVDVQILMPKHSNHLLADIGRGSYIRQIQAAGATILLHPKMVHAKATIIDETCAIVGSANMDMRSFFSNYEVSVFIYSKTTINSVADWFSHLSKECTKELLKPYFGEKTLENTIRILSPLL